MKGCVGESDKLVRGANKVLLPLTRRESEGSQTDLPSQLEIVVKVKKRLLTVERAFLLRQLLAGKWCPHP